MPENEEKEYDNVSIFVSSTFLDMQAERDALRYKVLPKINEFAEKYGCAVEIIDLRWGVGTASVSEEEKNRKVLRTCLDEIERSRPFFLGLIGDRYGWTPSNEHIEAVLKELQISSEAKKFLRENPKMSVTELEIEYGALSSEKSDKPPVCLFYFRKSHDVPDEFRQTYRRLYQDKAENLAKLEELKAKIRARFGQDVKTYAAKVCGNELVVDEKWVETVKDDIIAKLREAWGDEPPKTPSDWKALERKTQKRFRKSRTAYFAGRASAIEHMEAFCLGENATPRILMIQGEAGSGKSGLLCKVMDAIEGKCVLLPFSCGITPYSSRVEDMLRYFIYLLCEKLKLENDSESRIKFQDLKDRVIELLKVADERKLRVVAVVDALDQLAESDAARKMQWVDKRMPENFRLLCSIIDGPEIEAVIQHGGKVEPIRPISKEDERRVINVMAERHHKQINDAVVEHIRRKKTPIRARAAQNPPTRARRARAAKNPLYLSLIIQNLVMMDSDDDAKVHEYEEREKGAAKYDNALIKFMKERIDETPGDPEGAYLAILNRLENRINPENRADPENLVVNGFVRRVCGMIAISRGGLREDDLKGALEKVGTGFDSADFSWLRHIFPNHFTRGDAQQWDFAHPSMRRALLKNLKEEMREEQELLNNGIVEHFREALAKESDKFAAREIMHHLGLANKPDVAAEVIAEHYDGHGEALARGLADVYTECENGKEFLSGVPKSAENVEYKKRRFITECIREVLPLLQENTSVYDRIDLMLGALGIIGGRYDHPLMVVSDARGGYVPYDHNWWDVDIKTLGVMLHGQSTVANLYLCAMGEEHDQLLNAVRLAARNAEKYYNVVGSTLDHIQDRDDCELPRGFSLPWFYQDRGYYETKIGDIESAYSYYCCAQYRNYNYDGTTIEAMMKKLSAELIEETVIMYNNNMSINLTMLGKTEEADKCHQKAVEALRVYEQAGSTSTLMAISYAIIGGYLTMLGKTEEADPYYRKALKAMELINERTRTTEALRNLAILYDKMGAHLTACRQNEEAGEYYKKAIDAWKRVWRKSDADTAGYGDMLVSYVNMGNHLVALGKIEEAGEYYQYIIDDSSFHSEWIESWCDAERRAYVFVYVGEYLAALGKNAYIYHQMAIEAMDEIYMKTGIATLGVPSASYTCSGHYLLNTLGKTEENVEYYRRVIDRMRMTPCECEMRLKSYRVMWGYLTGLGKMEEAYEYYQKAVDLMEQFREFDEALNKTCFIMWIHLTKLGKTEDADKYFQKLSSYHVFCDDRLIRSHVYKLSGNIRTYYYLKVHEARARCRERGDGCFCPFDVSGFGESGFCNISLPVEYKAIGDCLKELGKPEEAEIYYQKVKEEEAKYYD